MINGLIATFSKMTGAQARPATLVDWAVSPELVTVDQSAFLLGVDVATMRAIIDAGGVDLVERGEDTLIDLATLRAYWETYWELARDATRPND